VADNGNGPIVVRLSGQTEVDNWLRGPLMTLASSTNS